FLRHWSEGIPIVVTDLKMQGNWGPEYFIEQYGTTEVTLEDCETEVVWPSKVVDFFQTFLEVGKWTRITKLKVSSLLYTKSTSSHGMQDWPLRENFSTKLLELHKSFAKFVPCPALVLPDGVLNAALHYPLNGIAPDTGPKMYFAYKTVSDDHHNGSTKLHMDLTDAVNVMLWASPDPDKQPGYALWRIFPATSAPLLHRFIREECGFTGPRDPVHSQCIYLSPNKCELFFKKYGIRPYTIRQYPNQAVFIPAYCAHQVG
ncbi:hypothetical protein PILCRDRAFT_60651, partial [Piloderma croceum F 1598]